MCLAFFEGKGYSDAFTEHMTQMSERLMKNPRVTLVEDLDDICAMCPNHVNGRCVTQEKVKRYDRAVLAECGLLPGRIVSWQEFAGLVMEKIIRTGNRREICGDCRWDAICSRKERQLLVKSEAADGRGLPAESGKPVERLETAVILSEGELAELSKRYHMGADGTALMNAVYQKLHPPVAASCYFRAETARFDFCGIITLGEEPDAQKAEYEKEQQLLEVYVLDGICMALLEKGCQALAEEIKKRRGRYVKRFLFPGDAISLAENAEIVKRLENPIFGNEAGVLKPRQSLAFYGVLTNEKSEQRLSPCAGCSRRADCARGRGVQVEC